MKAAPINYQQDPEIQHELDMHQARESARRMACRRECGESTPDAPIEKHSIGCPFWEAK